ncbi:MAG: hypothetical protein NT074_07390 [Methanomicrobiales archaeon]|nr:hypothetical protein [Methanomicrobiales archaeon]
MRLKRAIHKTAFLTVFALMALTLIAGCTAPLPSTPPNQGGNTMGTATPITFTPGQTVTMPPGSEVIVQVNQKNTSDATISVIFSGGAGQNSVKRCEVRVTKSDGTTETADLKPEKQEVVTIKGTRGDDRVEVYVTMNTGMTYKIADQVLPFWNRR